MKYLLDKARVQHQEVSRAVARLCNADYAVAEDMTGEYIARKLVAALPTCASRLEVTETLFTALCDLMPAPGWNEMGTEMTRLYEFANWMTPALCNMSYLNQTFQIQHHAYCKPISGDQK